MNGVILCVGKLKEKWQQQGCEEYLKRLGRYGRYEVTAVDDLPAPER
ncbi:MAG: 23S rRNA (pseudouridine(1915)-N(3))-methyltransferase RlmH, partial [Clostridia bacterium]|nr:23S rRNA (pseudouridine(1915)-N(3))-methyltransferase RlmH [Clostridia bacterium]